MSLYLVLHNLTAGSKDVAANSDNKVANISGDGHHIIYKKRLIKPKSTNINFVPQIYQLNGFHPPVNCFS